MGIWVGRYAMVQGQVREHGPWLVDQVHQRDGESVRLLILAEPVDDYAVEFCGEVAEAVASLFAREELSITGGLLRAFRQVHENLSEWNDRSLGEHRVAVGLICVAIRDSEATIAQLGDGLVYLVKGREVRRSRAKVLDGREPLGGIQPVAPSFVTVQLGTEHMLLLSSAVGKSISEEDIFESLGAGPERALAKLFTLTSDVPDMTAVLIAELDIENDTPPLGEPDAALPSAPVLDSGAADDQLSPSVGRSDSRFRAPMPSVRDPRRRLEAPNSYFGAGEDKSLRWSWIVVALSAIIALVTFIVLLLPGLLERDDTNRFEASLTEATIRIEEAQLARSPDHKRNALVLGFSALERARAVDADHPRLLDIEGEILDLLAELDNVVQIEELRLVFSFAGSVTSPLQPSSIVVGGGSLWVMDSAQGRVIKFGLNGNPDSFTVYDETSQYGDRVAAAPRSMSWDERENRLIVLDDENQLWALGLDKENKPISLVLRGVDELRSVTAIATYLGNLYLLDSEAGEVWRYFPVGVGSGYDSERAGLLGGIEFSDATALVVDGDIYVQDSSNLRRFHQGIEQPSLMLGIDEPPIMAVAVVEDTINDLIFVADRGKGRVVVSDRDGLFVRQYRHDGLADLRGIALSKDVETLFILTSDAISSFSVYGSDS